MTVGAIPIFESHDSVFFVGGRGAKTGDNNAGGGALQTYWGDLDSPDIDLSDVMGANGEVLSGAGAWNGCQTACSITLAADACHIQVNKAGAFPLPIAAGLICKMKFHAASPYVGDDGRYQVVGRVDNDAIVVNIVHVGDDPNHCDCKVGGAFPTLQKASDETDANSTSPKNVYILTNKTKTYVAATAVDIDAGGGDLTLNTWKRIKGMDSDGVELEPGYWVEFDGASYATHGITVDLVDNIEIGHLWVHDISGANSCFQFNDTASHYGFLLHECKGTSAQYGVMVEGTAVRNLGIIGGKFNVTQIGIYIKNVMGATIRGVDVYCSGSSCMYISYYGASVDGCVIRGDGATVGITIASVNMAVITNNIFYNVAVGMGLGDNNSAIFEYNNIYVVALAASGKAINQTGGGLYSDYSCMWALDGAPAASGRWGDGGIGRNSIEAAPLFVDADNGDFRLQLSSPCLRTGRSTLGQL